MFKTTILAVLFVIFIPIVSYKPQLVQPPNIIFILTDDQSYESLAHMPFTGTRAGWFNFTNAYVNVALCCPSRATILSGRYSHKSGVENNKLGYLHNDTIDIAARLNAVGHTTAYYGKYLNGFPFGGEPYVPMGWDKWEVFHKSSIVTRYYYDYTISDENLVEIARGSTPKDYSTNVFAGKAINFVKTAEPPFFLFLAPFAPHFPYIPAPRHVNADVGTAPRYPNYNEDDVSDKPAWVQALPKRDNARTDKARLDQYRTLLAVDETIKKIIAVLVNRKIYGNTIIIFTSDNGYSAGEHRHIEKICEYDECIHVPLLIRYPRLVGRQVPQMISNIDIAPTIAELAGVPRDGFDGQSLIPLLTNANTPWREEILFHWGGDRSATRIPAFWGVRTQDWKYVELDTGERELYDLANDPYEMDNRYGQPGYEAITQDLQLRLEELKK